MTQMRTGSFSFLGCFVPTVVRMKVTIFETLNENLCLYAFIIVDLHCGLLNCVFFSNQISNDTYDIVLPLKVTGCCCSSTQQTISVLPKKTI